MKFNILPPMFTRQLPFFDKPQTSIAVLFGYFFLYCYFINLQLLFLPEISLSFEQFNSSIFAVGDHLLFVLVWILLLFMLNKLKLPTLFVVLISVLIGLIPIIDSVYYHIFYQHLSWSAHESGMQFGQLWDSFYAELQMMDWFNLLVLLLIQVPLISFMSQKKLIWCKHNSWWRHQSRPKLILLLLVTLIFSYGFSSGNLHYNPVIRSLFSLIDKQQNIYNPVSGNVPTDLNSLSKKDDEMSLISLKALYQPIYGEDKYQRIEAVAKNKLKPAKNIILIVLESVGALQLFPEGKITEHTSPFLASIKQHTSLFNTIYGFYPATTRAHVPIQTGGFSITYATTQQLQNPYLGATIVSSLKKSNYQCALFSAQNLDFGNLSHFYQQMNFDKYFDPQQADKTFIKKNSESSWGVLETSVLPQAFDWIDKTRAQKQPFFLQFLTSSTHHPYVYPGSKKERDKQSRIARYKKSLAYTDQILAEIWQSLKQRHLLDNTVIYITGDHGQAFALRHKKNMTHRNFIYEENIRSFLLRIDRSQKQQQTISRPGSMGDILPTVIAESTTPASTQEQSSQNQSNQDKQQQNKNENLNLVMGENLFDANYSLKLQFFHKHQMPAQWGLRDGKWKYISRQTGTKHAELFNLEKDADEKINLATKYPQRIQQYQHRIARWSANMQQVFGQRLEAKDLLQLSANDLSVQGPKYLRLGIKPKDKPFTKLDQFHPDEDIVAQIYRIPDDKVHKYQFIWTSPNGKEFSHSSEVEDDRERVYDDLDFPSKIPPGKWQLKVVTDENKSFVQSFNVTPTAPLLDPRNRALGPQQLSFAYQDNLGNFHQQSTFHPNEKIIVQGIGLAYPEKNQLKLNWISPSAIKFQQTISMAKDQTEFSVTLNGDWPLEKGVWQVKVLNKEVELATSSFTIDSLNSLHQPRLLTREQRTQQLKQNFILQSANDISPASKNPVKNSTNLIVVIDDNVNKAQMQLYGYHRANLPNLQTLMDQQKLWSFKSVYTDVSPAGSKQIPLLLFAEAKIIEDPLNRINPSLIDVLNAANIKTMWIAPEKETIYGENYRRLASNSVIIKEVNGVIDQFELLQQIKLSLHKNTFDQSDQQNLNGLAIFIHLPLKSENKADGKGINENKCSTANLSTAITDTIADTITTKTYAGLLLEGEFGKNSNSKTISQAVNCHDNYIMQIDKLLADIIALPEMKSTASMLWYTSSYTPQLFEKTGHLDENLSNQIRDIPLIAWFSNQFQVQNQQQLSTLKTHTFSHYPIDEFYNTLLGLMPVKTNLYYPQRDLSNILYQQKLLKQSKNDETRQRYTQQQHIQQIKNAGLEQRILPHRVNSIGKLKQVVYDGFQGFELDLLFRAKSDKSGYFEVGHDESSTSTLTLETFLSQLDSNNYKIWFDIKNISPENMDSVISRLNQLDRQFSIKDRVIIETQTNTNESLKLANNDYYSSYYLPTQQIKELISKKNMQAINEYAQTLAMWLTDQQFQAISFDSDLYVFVKLYLQPLLSHNIEYHIWDVSIPLYETDFWDKLFQKPYYVDDRVKTILMAYYSEFTL